MTPSLDDQLRSYGALLDEAAPSLTLDEAVERGLLTLDVPEQRSGGRPLVLIAAAVVIVMVIGAAALASRGGDNDAVRISQPTMATPSPTTPPDTAVPLTTTPPSRDSSACSMCSSETPYQLVIPTVGVDVPVRKQWDGGPQAPGIDERSVAIGDPGVTQIWGHRTNHGREFEHLDQLLLGDRIEVETAEGTYVFSVSSVEVVTRGTQLTPGTGSMLVLSTLAPKFGNDLELRVTARLTPASAASPRPLRMSDQDLSDWAGPISIRYEDARMVLGSTGTAEFVLEMTQSRFCLEPAGGCAYTGDGSPLDTTPRPGVSAGASVDADGSWVRSIVVPDDVSVQFVTGGRPACEMHRFSLEQWGNAVVWACESDVPLTEDLEWLLSRDGQQAITIAEPFGRQSLPKSDPVTATGVRIGDPGGDLGPSWFEGWVPVVDGDTSVVVGYATTADAAKQSGPVPVYDETGTIIGELDDRWRLP